LYIGNSNSVSSIGYAKVPQQDGSRIKANNGECFIDIVRDYYGSTQPQPIALDSTGVSYWQIKGAYEGFGEFGAVPQKLYQWVL